MIDKIYNRVISYVNNLTLIKYNIQKCHFREELIEYVALPCSYDIETTSFRIGEDRLATAYAMDIISINELRARICSAVLMLSAKNTPLASRRKVLPL